MLAQVCSFWEVLPKKPICILICATLPRAFGIAKVNVQPGVDFELTMIGHLGPLVPGQRSSKMVRQVHNCGLDGLIHRLGPVASQSRAILQSRPLPMPRHGRQMEQNGEAGGSFHQRTDCRTAQSKNEIAFPMAWHGSICRFGGAFADHDV